MNNRQHKFILRSGVLVLNRTLGIFVTFRFTVGVRISVPFIFLINIKVSAVIVLI